jgi:hypothetical protein
MTTDMLGATTWPRKGGLSKHPEVRLSGRDCQVPLVKVVRLFIENVLGKTVFSTKCQAAFDNCTIIRYLSTNCLF